MKYSICEMTRKSSRLARLELVKVLKKLKPEERKILLSFMNDYSIYIVCSCV